MLSGAWLALNHTPFSLAILAAVIVLSLFGSIICIKAVMLHTGNSIVENYFDAGIEIAISTLAAIFFFTTENINAASDAKEAMIYLEGFLVLMFGAGIILTFKTVVIKTDQRINPKERQTEE